MNATALLKQGEPTRRPDNAEAYRTSAGPEAEETTISETAREFGVTLRTLRFYEDRGLIRPRRDGGARFYGPLERARVRMILNGKRLGFTLTEIADLIGAPDPVRATEADFERRLGPNQVSSQISHLERQRREIDEAIDRLRATHDRLISAV